MATKPTNQNENVAEEPFELITFGKGGQFTTLDADKTSSLIEQDDLTDELERRSRWRRVVERGVEIARKE
jgi:hypothetical protein